MHGRSSSAKASPAFKCSKAAYRPGPIAANRSPFRATSPGRWERQVRVTAGALVLTFCGLGLLASKKFFVGAGLVGAGLVYAGVSDTCMMSSVLGRMPWNAPPESAHASLNEG